MILRAAQIIITEKQKQKVLQFGKLSENNGSDYYFIGLLFQNFKIEFQLK